MQMQKLITGYAQDIIISLHDLHLTLFTVSLQLYDICK